MKMLAVIIIVLLLLVLKIMHDIRRCKNCCETPNGFGQCEGKNSI